MSDDFWKSLSDKEKRLVGDEIHRRQMSVVAQFIGVLFVLGALAAIFARIVLERMGQ